MIVTMAVVVLMAVVPELRLVEQKEKHQARQQRGKQLLRAGLALQRLGQQVHESRGHQRAGGQAEHVLGVARQHGKAQKSRQPDAAHASGDGSDQDRYQDHLVLLSPQKRRAARACAAHP
ncbi:hypothetical protein D9M68_922470 [compost metagenome]